MPKPKEECWEDLVLETVRATGCQNMKGWSDGLPLRDGLAKSGQGFGPHRSQARGGKILSDWLGMMGISEANRRLKG